MPALAQLSRGTDETGPPASATGKRALVMCLDVNTCETIAHEIRANDSEADVAATDGYSDIRDPAERARLLERVRRGDYTSLITGFPGSSWATSRNSTRDGICARHLARGRRCETVTTCTG